MHYNCNISSSQNNIREVGLRSTAARKAVLGILESSQKPLDIASIFKEIARLQVNCDLATIYRIVENFCEKNLIVRLQFQKKKFFYELKRIEHHHAVCDKCGEVEDVSSCTIKRTEEKIEKASGFSVRNHLLEFFGVCRKCQSI